MIIKHLTASELHKSLITGNTEIRLDCDPSTIHYVWNPQLKTAIRISGETIIRIPITIFIPSLITFISMFEIIKTEPTIFITGQGIGILFFDIKEVTTDVS